MWLLFSLFHHQKRNPVIMLCEYVLVYGLIKYLCGCFLDLVNLLDSVVFLIALKYYKFGLLLFHLGFLMVCFVFSSQCAEYKNLRNNLPYHLVYGMFWYYNYLLSFLFC